MHTIRTVLLLCSAAGLAFACSSSTAVECHVGTDCASGACSLEGTCVPTGEAGADGGGATDSGVVIVDGSTNNEGGGNTDGSVGGCVPNNDGTITHDEVPLAAGLKATFRVATNETISTAGQTQPDGSRIWDFSGALASDQDQIVETLAMTGQWFAGDFTSATYASKLSSTSDLLGVFQYGTNALSLLGEVSPTSDGVTETEETYATPIPILQFPFKNGTSWTTTSNVTGKLNGVLDVYTEKYDTTVDAYGKVITPFATFNALRVSTLLTQTVGVVVTTTRVFTWETECYGTIAKATSTSNEQTVEFTQAAELTRLAL